MKAIIVNDCSRYEHFGCRMVMDGYRAQLERVGIELLDTVPNGALNRGISDKWARRFDKADLLIVNGEGSIHHDAHPNLIRLAARWPAVLMNGVYEANTPMPEMGRFLLRAMREPFSAEQIRREGWNCGVVPDVLISAPIFKNPPDVFVEFKTTFGWTDSSADGLPGNVPLVADPAEYMKSLAIFSQGVACGRFHAILLCARMRIPFAAYPANTWKNLSLMHDMGLQHLFCPDPLEALPPEVFPEEATHYLKWADGMVDLFFENLEGLV
jgi:hypothetical protein